MKTKSVHKISKTKEISYSRIREIFKGYTSEIAMTPENFGMHSLRSGGLQRKQGTVILKTL